MEESSIGGGRPVQEIAPSSTDHHGEIVKRNDTVKRSRSDSCFSFMEISIEPGIKSLKHLDSKKFKNQIKKWAKKVVTYARQVSDHFGSSRR